jgi:hypothetical protein
MPKTSALKKSDWDPTSIATELVARIYEDIVQERCVVFLGSGSTTERGHEGHLSYYDHIKEIAKFCGDRAPFPELMQYFCDHVDGGSHNRLIREALSRIEIFCLRGEDNYTATLVTDALAEIPYFNRFVTTNWDPFLERSLDVLVPMVEDRDLAFWDDQKRQVLKIHGCITRPYSIVATQTDYDTCMAKNPLVFNKLKDLMATKTFLFSGYSMRDADFKSVWELISGSLGHFRHLAFAVDPRVTNEQTGYWKERGIHIFKTTDVMFFRKLRQRLESEGKIPSDKFLEFLGRERHRIGRIHINMGQTSSGRFASAMYQDGLMHELDSVIAGARLGTKKKEDFENDLGESLRRLDAMRKKQDIVEIAYWSGRVEILERFDLRQQTPIPKFFHPNKLQPIPHLVKGDSLS